MILIGGEARSGTTLLQVMLDSHPELHVGPEMHLRNGPDYGPSILKWLEAGDYDDKSSHAYRFCHRARRFGLDWGDIRACVALVDECNRSWDRPAGDLAARCSVVGMVASFAASAGQRPGLKVMRDIVLHAKLREVWPTAQFLLMVRDPRDVWCSHRQYPSGYWKSIEKGVAQWSKTLAACHGEDVGWVEYESLVHGPESTMRDILEWLLVDWDPAVLEHSTQPHAFFDHPAGHQSIHQVTKPVYTSAVGRWKNELGEEDVKRFEAADKECGGWMAKLGYL